LKKRFDPLWEVVDERIALQGEETHHNPCCPRCYVAINLVAQAKSGVRLRCGLCGTLCQLVQGSSEAELVAVGPEGSG
jgi:ribosomal protein S27AE